MIRFVEPVSPRRADGLVADVYADIKRHFGWLQVPLTGRSPYPAHSPAPELLAGMWSAQHETMLVAGRLSRADKEAIAAAVSQINACRFCADAHALLSREAHAAGQVADAPRPRLVQWAAATRSPTEPTLRDPPFAPDEAPEAIGTAFLFHYVNRVVEVFVGPDGMLPNVGPFGRPARHGALRMARAALRREREPGRTLHLLPAAEVPPSLAWASGTPHIAGALARFIAAVEHAGADALPERARARISERVRAWNGEDPGLGTAWLDEALDGLEADDRPAARLGLLTALAPYRVDDAVVDAVRANGAGDRELVGAVSWSALTAAQRITSWLDG